MVSVFIRNPRDEESLRATQQWDQEQVWANTAKIIQGLQLPRYMIGDMPSVVLSSYMADGLGSVDYLKVLEMKSQGLTKPNFDFLCSVVASNRALEQLHLSGCWHEESPLDQNPSQDSAYRALAKAIGTSSSLRILRISEMDMVYDGFLANLFAGSAHKLEKFTLSYTGVEIASMEAIREALEHPECKIQALDLSGIENPANIALIAGALESNSSLKELSFSYSTQLPGDQVNALVRALRRNSTLEKLEMCSNRHEIPERLLSPEGWNVLSRGLKDTKSLKHLDISGNDFTVHVIENFVRGLKENESLTHLTMQDIGVASEGLGLIGDLIQTRGFKLLDISNSMSRGMTDRFFASIGLSLEKNTGLEVLKMSNVNIEGPNGIKPIINALARNTTIRELDVSGNGEDYLLGQLTDVLTKNQHLMKLSLKNVPLSEDDFDYFAKSMPKMKGLETIMFGDLHHTMAVSFLNGLKENTSLKHVDGRFGDENCWRMVDFFLRLNRGGRKNLMGPQRVPLFLLPRMLSKSSSDPDILFFFLKEIQLHV